MTHGTARISDLVFPVSNWNPSASASEYFVYVDISSVDVSQKMIAEPKSIPSSSAPSRARQLLKPADVLVSSVRPNLNCVAYVPTELEGAIASTGFCVLRPDKQALDSRYLFHWVQSKAFIGDMVSKATGASYPAVSDSIIHASEIPLPPLEEQRRIAAILDRAKGIKAKAAQRSGLLAALSTSFFVRRFGLPSENPYELPIYKLVDICNPKQWPTISSKQLQGAGYPVFGANGLIGYFDRFNHPDPTVLVTCRGATCGTINISPPNCYVTGNSMAMDNPDPGLITKDYLAWVLRLRGMNDVISGSAQPQITRQGLEAVTIPVPSIDAQSYFANELRSVTRMGKSSRISESSISEAAECLAARFFGGGNT